MSADLHLPSNRKFGFFFAVVFALLGGYIYSIGEVLIASIFAGLAVVFLILGFLDSSLLLPLNKLWMSFGLLLGKIVSPIVLGVIFFFVFTTFGLMMRLFGRDELGLKPTSAQSYWKVRKPSGPTADSFKTQF